jgi:PPP family 3-phenylpropionic acid transporter
VDVTARRFAVLYFLLDMSLGAHFPYLFLFLERRGLSDIQLGTLAAVPPVIHMFAPPLWGAIADRVQDRRSVLTLLLVFSAATFPLLALAQGFDQALIMMVVFSVFSLPPMALADSMALQHLKGSGGEYGRIRLWGSLGFTVPLMAFGAMLGRAPRQSAESLWPIFLVYALTRLFAAGWCRRLPPSHRSAGEAARLTHARALLSSRFLWLATAGIIATVALAGQRVFFTIYLDTLGIADSMKGAFWAVALLSEVVVLTFVGRLIRRVGLKWLFAVGMLAIGVRMLAFSFPLPAWGIVLSQCLHGFVFAGTVVAAISFVSRIVPASVAATGQTVWMALTVGIGGAAGATAAGLAVDSYGIAGMYRLSAIAAGVALLVSVIALREPAPAEHHEKPA